ncbi:hypothetical protein [Nocardioides nitrophenolicus]|uniref:hypothetical protein n=1 Tax=Nocardioides nitrophenolicus TaxID=60489 RepID=UPI00195A6499|nr:hypothetical protein [Nocardioides nitrophenolicus]MBM7520259.1 hypothetical protein [Nocardioides nitrophenolicus]
MSERDVAELEQLLTGTGASGPGPDLDLIRRRGRSRRRVRRLGAAGTVVAGATLVTVIAVAATGGSERAADPAAPTRSAAPTSEGLSELARRALAEIPGAEQVSPSLVAIPAPGSRSLGGDIPVEVHGEAVELPDEAFLGVTLFDRKDLPAWLYDGTEATERAAGDEEDGWETGTTDLTGVAVDAGPRYLGCVTTEGAGELPEGVTCYPAMLTRQGDSWNYEWGMGTERFLQRGAPMEVFTTESDADGVPGTLAIAGLDGTDVARAVFVGTDGAQVEGTVLAGTLVPGESMFFGEVAGPLARVIAYDASGEVIEDHPLRDCDDPVDCEVR